MTSTGAFLYLTDADVRALALDVRSVRLAIHESFALYDRGEVRCEPKASLSIGPGHAFQALTAVDTRNNYAALKWLGMVPPGSAAPVNINASLLLSDTCSGQLRCFMDARHATALRTAGMSAVAAQYLARKDSVSIGFVGAGVQAESHLLALTEVLPSLRIVHVNSLSAATSERFAEMARRLNLEAVIAPAKDVVSLSDVVVTAVPLAAGFEPFIDAAWVKAGSLVLAIDLGRSWKHEGLSSMDLTLVDDAAMKSYARPGNFIPQLDHAKAALADLAGSRHPGRSRQEERIMMFSAGSAVADLSIAKLIYERALAGGIGTKLEN